MKPIRNILEQCILLILTIVSLVSCSKDFLNENPRTDLILPTTYREMWALLDNDRIMNRTPVMGELSADNYYLTDTYWQTLTENHERNCYWWAPDIYQGQQNVDDWSNSYTQVLHANVVLEALENIRETHASEEEWRNIRGSALFFRANAFFNLAQVFAPMYDPVTAETDLGIPLRLVSEINTAYPRASVDSTYKQILNDLDAAETLISTGISFQYRNRPSKPAVLALKARVYLSMRNYEKADIYADLALQLHDSLINFNSLDIVTPLPFTRENPEIIFLSQYLENNVITGVAFPEVIVDTALYESYSNSDLRRSIYYFSGFLGYINLKGGFSGGVYPFTGLATDELMLIRSECLARSENIALAMEYLNSLLITRWKTDQYTSYTASNREEALAIILTERRKELAFRGGRWSDLRRLNKEGYNITLQRIVNSQLRTLSPNSKLYVLPIPPDVLNRSGIPNNDRD